MHLLEIEHSAILASLYELVRFERDYEQAKLESLCRQIETHLTAEFGVFYQRASEYLESEEVLIKAGEEYRRAMTAINEIRGGDPSAQAMGQQLTVLLEIFKQHIDRSEGPDGLHERASRLHIDWEEMKRSYLKRREELDA